MSRERFRLNVSVLGFPSGGGARRRFVLEVHANIAPDVVVAPEVIEALTALPEEFTHSSAIRSWSKVLSRIDAENLWRNLEASEVVVRSDADRRYDTWLRFGWEAAASYHAATRDFSFVQMDLPGAAKIDVARMNEYRHASLPPDIYQELPHRLRIPLRRVAPPFSQHIERLRSDARSGIDALAAVLDTSFGERGRVVFASQGSFLRKSVPSGGARHPTEVFLAVFGGWRLPIGTYHYDVRHHALDVLAEGDFSSQCEDATFDLFRKFDERPLALVVFTSLVSRAMWRYRDSRSARAILMDAGHAVMAFRTVTSALGLRRYTYQKFKDHDLAALFGLDPVAQPPLMAATIV